MQVNHDSQEVLEGWLVIFHVVQEKEQIVVDLLLNQLRSLLFGLWREKRPMQVRDQLVGESLTCGFIPGMLLKKLRIV